MKKLFLLLLPLLLSTNAAFAQVPDGPTELTGGAAYSQTRLEPFKTHTGAGISARLHASLIDLLITRGLKQSFRFRGGDYLAAEGAIGLKSSDDSLRTDKYWYLRSFEVGVQGFYSVSRHVYLGARAYRMRVTDETRQSGPFQEAVQDFTVFKLVGKAHRVAAEVGLSLPEDNPGENATGTTRYLSVSLRYLWFDDYFIGGRYDQFRSKAAFDPGAQPADPPLTGTGYDSQSFRIYFGKYF